MKNEIVQGQISLFDKQPTPKPKININIFNKVVEQYRSSCTRIARMGDLLLVELKEKTISFDTKGKQRIFDININLRPKDEILVSNKDKQVTEAQIKMLGRIKSKVYIKRKSDSNIIIPLDDVSITIYPTGHIARWSHRAIYKEDEIFIVKTQDDLQEIKDKEVNQKKLIDTGLKAGDIVEFEYDGSIYKGEVVRVYNNNETVNVTWNNRQTAFYYKSVKKINAA